MSNPNPHFIKAVSAGQKLSPEKQLPYRAALVGIFCSPEPVKAEVENALKMLAESGADPSPMIQGISDHFFGPRGLQSPSNPF